MAVQRSLDRTAGSTFGETLSTLGNGFTVSEGSGAARRLEPREEATRVERLIANIDPSDLLYTQ
jgi:hypothetical protein